MQYLSITDAQSEPHKLTTSATCRPEFFGFQVLAEINDHRISSLLLQPNFHHSFILLQCSDKKAAKIKSIFAQTTLFCASSEMFLLLQTYSKSSLLRSSTVFIWNVSLGHLQWPPIAWNISVSNARKTIFWRSALSFFFRLSKFGHLYDSLRFSEWVGGRGSAGCCSTGGPSPSIQTFDCSLSFWISKTHKKKSDME